MKSLVLLGALLITAGAYAQTAVVDDGKAWPEAQFEIFKLAPGKHESLIRKLAQWDQVSAAGDQPPTQMFIHQDGADWDVLLFKPFPKTPITSAQQAAMDAKADELHLKTGPAFFLEMRENVAAHTDSKTLGPLSAAQWLARLDAWRAAHHDDGWKETENGNWTHISTAGVVAGTVFLNRYGHWQIIVQTEFVVDWSPTNISSAQTQLGTVLRQYFTGHSADSCPSGIAAS